METLRLRLAWAGLTVNAVASWGSSAWVAYSSPKVAIPAANRAPLIRRNAVVPAVTPSESSGCAAAGRRVAEVTGLTLRAYLSYVQYGQ